MLISQVLTADAHTVAPKDIQWSDARSGTDIRRSNAADGWLVDAIGMVHGFFSCRQLAAAAPRFSCARSVRRDSEHNMHAERWQPEETAGWVSLLLFNYAVSIMKLGSRKYLIQEDLWDVSRCCLVLSAQSMARTPSCRPSLTASCTHQRLECCPASTDPISVS